MRQFRAYSPDLKRWVKGYYYMQKAGGIDGSKGADVHFIMENNSTQLIDIETLGQQTGVLDRHGVEIYEGDTLRAEYLTGSHSELKDVIVSIVIYDVCKFTTELKELSESKLLSRIDLSRDAKRCEVVGNIHEK